MEMRIRPALPSDAQECGRICYEAFAAVSSAHGFPPDYESIEDATEAITGLIDHPGFFGVVAERDGRLVGSNFVDERSLISGLGPLSIDPAARERQAGRALMRAVIEHAVQRRPPGMRFMQAAYNLRSMSLHTKLGFDFREPFAAMHGQPLGLELPGYDVRPATDSDVPACNELCARVHGHARAGEVADAAAYGTAKVVERQGRITGYTTGIALYAHSIAETDDDLIALLGAAADPAGPKFLVPMRNGELLRWCLAHGMRIALTMNLMTSGLYQEPRGAYLPSVLY